MTNALSSLRPVAAVSIATAAAVFVTASLSTETWGWPDQVTSNGLRWRFNVATGPIALVLLFLVAGSTTTNDLQVPTHLIEVLAGHELALTLVKLEPR